MKVVFQISLMLVAATLLPAFKVDRAPASSSDGVIKGGRVYRTLPRYNVPIPTSRYELPTRNVPIPRFRDDELARGHEDEEPTLGSYRTENVRPESLDTSGDIPDLQKALRNTRNQSRLCQADFVRNTRLKNPKASNEMKQDLNVYLANGRRAGVSNSQMRQTLAAYAKNKNVLGNQRYLSIIDYSKKSNQKRMHILDLRTGKIESFHTAHGKGSDPRGTGRGQIFSNKSGGRASSLGCMITGGTYQGGNGLSMRLHGLEPGKNDRSCGRSVVIHSAGYVGGVPARSWGCPAVRRGDRAKVFDRLAKGALVCAFNGDKK